MNTVSDKGIATINTLSNLVLRRRGDSAVEFYNAANRLYVLHFIEVAAIGDHRVLYFMLNLAEGKRGGVPDKEMGRMIVAIITQFLVEHPDDLLCYCHYDNILTNALNRIFHLWAHCNTDIIDGKISFFDGASHSAMGKGLHFMVMHNIGCKDFDELKAYILENSEEFAVCVREQMNLLVEIEERMHKSDNAVC